MELLVLNQNLDAISVLDTFESLIWKDRYCGYGDFEIYTKMTKQAFDVLKKDNYLWLEGSEHIMIIETCNIKTDIEQGNSLIITGRSSESILDRRVVWKQTILTGSLQNGIHRLLVENVIQPEIQERQIPNIEFVESTDPYIVGLNLDAQYTLTNLYDTIKSLCDINSIGFKMVLSDVRNVIEFSLYNGADRSYDQIANPYVVFSPKFENIINSNYIESSRLLKNVTVVAGEGEGLDRVTSVVGEAMGLARREMYTDARDVNKRTDTGTLTDEEYLLQLRQRGIKDLVEHLLAQSFDGQVDPTRMFKYGTDFFMGDVVQIANEYGINSKARITEIIRSQSESSIDVYPTFVMLE